MRFAPCMGFCKSDSPGQGLFDRTGIWALALVLLLATMPAVGQETRPAATSEPATSIDEQLDAAIQAVRAQRYADAEGMLKMLLEKDPTNLRAMSTLGFAYERLANVARADESDPASQQKYERYIGQAIKVYLQASERAMELDETDSAEQMYDRILSHDPGNPEGLLGQARLFAKTGRALQSIGKYTDYLKLETLATHQLEAHLELGRVYVRAGYWRQATRTLKKAGELDPGNAEVDRLLAEAYIGLNRIDGPNGAMAAIQSAIRKAPNDAEIRNRLAEIMLALKQVEQAVDEAREAIRLSNEKLEKNPGNKETLDSMGRYFPTFRKALSMLLAEDKGNIKRRLELVLAIQEEADIKQSLSDHQSLEVLLQAPAKDKENVEYLENLAAIQVNIQREAVAETCQQLLRLDPDNKTAKDILAQVAGGSTATAPSK